MVHLPAEASVESRTARERRGQASSPANIAFLGFRTSALLVFVLQSVFYGKKLELGCREEMESWSMCFCTASGPEQMT